MCFFCFLVLRRAISICAHCSTWMFKPHFSGFWFGKYFLTKHACHIFFILCAHVWSGFLSVLLWFWSTCSRKSLRKIRSIWIQSWVSFFFNSLKHRLDVRRAGSPRLLAFSSHWNVCSGALSMSWGCCLINPGVHTNFKGMQNVVSHCEFENQAP